MRPTRSANPSCCHRPVIELRSFKSALCRVFIKAQTVPCRREDEIVKCQSDCSDELETRTPVVSAGGSYDTFWFADSSCHRDRGYDRPSGVLAHASSRPAKFPLVAARCRQSLVATLGIPGDSGADQSGYEPKARAIGSNYVFAVGGKGCLPCSVAGNLEKAVTVTAPMKLGSTGPRARGCHAAHCSIGSGC